MKKLLLASALVLGTLTGSFCMLHAQEKTVKHNEPVWLTDWTQAQAEAKKTGKVIFADFTGSDWCGWCIKLHNEVLVKKPFLDYAKKNLILLTIDFPRKRWQTPAEKKANQALAKKYGVRGFPTIILLSADGQVIGKTGYQRGGAENYVRNLKNILKKNSVAQGE